MIPFFVESAPESDPGVKWAGSGADSSVETAPM